MPKVTAVFYLNEIGKRDNLEDSIYPLPGQSSMGNKIFIVCDGVGGLNKGEVASKIVSQVMGEVLESKNKITQGDIEGAKQEAITAMLDYQRQHGEAKSMATTLTLVSLNDDSVLLAWCGDSRIIHIRNGEIIYQTPDHSLVGELVKTKQITLQEARSHPLRNKILRSLNPEGIQSEIEYHVIKDLQEGDFILLCSDGVLENLDDVHISRIFTNKVPGYDFGKAIANLCLGKTSDNYSMYLLKLDDVKLPVKRSAKKIVTVLAAVMVLAASFFLGFKYFSNRGTTENVQEKKPAVEKEQKKIENNSASVAVTSIPEVKTSDAGLQTTDQTAIEKSKEVTVIKQGYPGGEKSWTNFANKNIQYPDSARSDSISGVAKIQFTITEKGSAINFVKKSSLGSGVEEELIRVISMAKWIPNSIEGVSKPSTYIASYKFILPKIKQEVKQTAVPEPTTKQDQ